MPTPDGPSYFDNGQLVTRWFWKLVTVYGGYRVARCRWVLDRNECWDEEQHFEHEAPFSEEEKPIAEACAAAFNRAADEMHEHAARVLGLDKGNAPGLGLLE